MPSGRGSYHRDQMGKIVGVPHHLPQPDTGKCVTVNFVRMHISHRHEHLPRQLSDIQSGGHVGTGVF